MSQAADTAYARQRNRRGEGRRLRDDIVAAATSLLETTGSTEAVTLRAVARLVGIAAPSIYPHFPDRQAIVVAVKEQVFRSVLAVLEASAAALDDPVVALQAGCAAYLRFAAEHPALYQAAFGQGMGDLDCSWPQGRRPSDDAGSPSGGAVLATGVAAFDVLVTGIRRCVDAGRSASTAPFDDAAALWVSLHGMATLTVAAGEFPWPDRDHLLDALVHRLARVA